MKKQTSWLLGLVLCACSASPSSELSELAESEPLPFSVLVTGGAFHLPVPQIGDKPGGRLTRTFDASPEVFSLRSIRRTLRTARVFVAQEEGKQPAALRRRIANLRQPVATDDEALMELLAGAATNGHDLLLVIERVQDGPILDQGINGRWPITLATWLFALGAFIPDRTFESAAQLHASLRDVRTGEVLQSAVLSPSPVDMSLLQRAGFLGFVESIIVPPFWTEWSDERVGSKVAEVTVEQLGVALARQLKSATVRQSLDAHGVARIVVQRQGQGIRVTVDSAEALSYLRMRVDLQTVRGSVFDAFEAALLASERKQGSRYLYQGNYPGRPKGRVLQVQARTVSARVASRSFANPGGR